MENRINENRKKIRLLRTQMLGAEAAIRAQIGRDEDCTETSLALMAMRAEMSALSKERGRLGDDREPILVEQLMHPRRGTGDEANRASEAAPCTQTRILKLSLGRLTTH